MPPPTATTASSTPATLWRVAASGLIVGTLAVVSAVSFAALVYAGPLSAHIGQSVAWALLATAVNLAVVARLATLPGTVGGSQSLPMAILATSAASVALAVQRPDGTADVASLHASVAVAMLLCTAGTGLMLLLLGHARAGRLVRFLPYPVLGGVIAGSGWVLAQGAFGIMAHDGAPHWHWMPGLVWAGLMLAVHRRSSHPLVMLGMLGLGVAAFYGVAWAAGATPADLARQGWLMRTPHWGADLSSQLAWPDIGAVDWRAVGSAAGELATVPLVAALALLLNAAGLESEARRPVDFDRELRTAGLANVASGLAGGYVGYQQLGMSMMNLRAGAASRWVGVWAALVCLAALAFGAHALAWLPLPVLGGQLLFLALLRGQEWLQASWGRLSAVDHAIVALILVVTALWGFLPAVVLGLAAAVLMFALQYSRIDPVRQVLSGAQYSSRAARTPAQRQHLQKLGGAVCAMQLQGYLFFGVAERVLLGAGQRLQAGPAAPTKPSSPQLRYLLLDCRRVTGCDSSSAQSFARLHDVLSAEGAVLVFCHASAALRAQLQAADLRSSLDACPHFDDLDHGLEWCETQLLQDMAPGQPSPVPVPTSAPIPTPTLHDALDDALAATGVAAPLLSHMERLTLHTGQVLIAEGAQSTDLYLLASGALNAQRLRGDEPPIRLQSMSSVGDVVGEVGFFLHTPRTAAVVALAPTVVYQLTAEKLVTMEQQHPALAIALHRMLARLLAARVSHLVGVVDALER